VVIETTMSIRNAQIVGVLNKSGHYITKEVSLRAHLLTVAEYDLHVFEYWPHSRFSLHSTDLKVLHHIHQHLIGRPPSYVSSELGNS
jgi:hypothetical protein